MREKGSDDAPAMFPQQSVWSSSPLSEGGDLTHVAGTVFPLSLPVWNPSVRTLLNYIFHICSS